jgi:hypothetical protein
MSNCEGAMAEMVADPTARGLRDLVNFMLVCIPIEELQKRKCVLVAASEQRNEGKEFKL